MTRCQFLEEAVKERDDMAAEREKEDRLQSGDESHGEELDVECEKEREVEVAESIGREVPTEMAKREFCLSFAKIALQLAKKTEISLVNHSAVSGVSFDAGEFCWNEKRADDCQRLLEDRRNDALATEGFKKDTFQNWKPLFCFKSYSLQEQCSSGSTEIDDDELVARRVFQLTEWSETFQASCSCCARTVSGKKSTREGDGAGKKMMG